MACCPIPGPGETKGCLLPRDATGTWACKLTEDDVLSTKFDPLSQLGRIQIKFSQGCNDEKWHTDTFNTLQVESVQEGQGRRVLIFPPHEHPPIQFRNCSAKAAVMFKQVLRSDHHKADPSWMTLKCHKGAKYSQQNYCHDDATDADLTYEIKIGNEKSTHILLNAPKPVQHPYTNEEGYDRTLYIISTVDPETQVRVILLGDRISDLRASLGLSKTVGAEELQKDIKLSITHIGISVIDSMPESVEMVKVCLLSALFGCAVSECS